MTPDTRYVMNLAGILVCAALACGDDGVAPTDSGTGGTSWTPMESGTDQNLNAVWAASATDVFAVGDGGTIRRFDGNTWKVMNSGTTDNLRGVWGTSGNHVIATSELGAILVFNGSDWVATPGVATDPIGPVSGLDANFVVAAGGGPPGSFLRFDGVDWTVVSTGGAETITDVVGVPGASEPAAVLVGNGGSAFVAGQDSVATIETGTTANLTAAFAAGVDDVIAVGDDGTVLDIDLTDYPYYVYVEPLTGPVADLTGVVRRGYNDLFVCAADGSVFGSDRCAVRSSKASGGSLFDMAVVSSSRIMVVGEGGTILSYAKPAPAGCPDAVSVTVSSGTTPSFSWSPACPVVLVLVEEDGGDTWLIEGDGNVINSGVRYGAHHPCETSYQYHAPLTHGVEYEVILFRYNGPDDYTLLAVKAFVP